MGLILEFYYFIYAVRYLPVFICTLVFTLGFRVFARTFSENDLLDISQISVCEIVV